MADQWQRQLLRGHLQAVLYAYGYLHGCQRDRSPLTACVLVEAPAQYSRVETHICNHGGTSQQSATQCAGACECQIYKASQMGWYSAGG